MNTKTGPLTKGHNSYPWVFQQIVEDLTTTNYKDIVNEEFQHISFIGTTNTGLSEKQGFKYDTLYDKSCVHTFELLICFDICNNSVSCKSLLT
jgi:hypothetical protein